MANVRLIKRRIKTANNISQITKAMELVAASKMKRAQQQAITGKLYADKIFTMVRTLASRTDTTHHPLLKQVDDQREDKRVASKRLVILISTNKGLCGGLNTNLFRFVMRQFPQQAAYDWISVGSKGSQFLAQLGVPLLADFSNVVPFVENVPAITEFAIEKFVAGEYQEVNLVFNEFLSALRYEPRAKQLLPIRMTDITESDASSPDAPAPLPFLIEPDPKAVFETLLPHYVENQVRDALLEAEASEHSARMVAMRNATDNARALMDDLSLVYNKARQEKITYEITDMVTARLAFEGVS